MLETGFVELAMRTTLFMAIGLIAARLIERRSATLAHRILAATGLCVVLLPILNLFGPRWEWSSPAWLSDNEPVAAAPMHIDNASAAPIDDSAIQVRSSPSSTVQLDRVSSWLGMGPTVWILGSCLMLARLIYALRRLSLALARCSAPSDAIQEEVHAMARTLGVNDPLQIKLSSRESMPMVCWFGHWFLVLPSNIAAWTAEVRYATLSHELGHISRRDVWVDYAIQTLRCLLWWHPLMGIMERAVTRLRELACDEWVLQTCRVSALNYSHALLDVVSRCQVDDLMLATPMATKEELEDRLRSIASPNRTRKVRRFWMLFCACGMLLLCLGVAAFTLVNKNLRSSGAESADENPTMKSGGSTITGLITHEGKPVAGVKIKVFKYLPLPEDQQVRGQFATGSAKVQLHARLETDEQGRYKITDMHPGDRYQLEVSPVGSLMVRNWQYHSPYVVSVNGTEGETIELPDAPLVSSAQSLQGVVVDPAGKPVPGISVSANLASGQMLSRPVDGPEPWTQTDQQGRFSLTSLPEEPIELMAYKPNPAGGRIIHPSKLKVDLHAKDIRMVFDPKLGSGIEDLDAK